MRKQVCACFLLWLLAVFHKKNSNTAYIGTQLNYIFKIKDKWKQDKMGEILNK